jgi:dCTP deaminase
MLLHHAELLQAMKAPFADRLVVTPLLEPTQVGPASVDLRLGTEFIELKRLERGTLDAFANESEVRSREERLSVGLGEHLVLHPGQFVLGATLEFLRMPRHLAGEVLNRSSWARMGLIVATAVFVQPGYAGVLTLELVNMGSVPMVLHPGLRIAQLVVSRLVDRSEYAYLESSPKYVTPLRPQITRLGWEDTEMARLKRIGNRLKGQHAP